MKIKSLYIFSIIFSLLNISCKDSTDSSSSADSKSSQEELNAIHKDVEFYLQLRAPHVPQSQATRPHMKSKDLANKKSWNLRLNSKQDKYEFNVTYVGSSATADNYEAEVIFNSSGAPVKETYTISYTGTQQIIHNVSSAIACEAGLRPRKK